MKRYIATFFAGAVIAASAFAGTYYEAKTTTQGGKGADAQRATVKAWVDGDAAKIEFVQSGNPLLQEGGYLVTRDGGETVYFVNPKDKTYAAFDMRGMMQFAGGAMKMVNMKISNPTVEKLEEKPGPPIVGLPTTYVKYRTTYTMSMSIMGFKSENKTDQVQEVWATPELAARAFGVWLRKEPPSLGDEEFDKLMRMEMGKVKGVPLKMITTTTTTDTKKGRTETTTTTMEVTTLQVVPVPASTFEIPASYTETQLLPMGGQEGEEGEGNPFSKMFGGKKKG